MTAEQARRNAERNERDAERLRTQYGSGVRPAWVSSELAILESFAAHYRKMEAELSV